jgi:hypothetical protein
MELKRELTLGEKRLRINFDDILTNECSEQLKLKYQLAKVINRIDALEQNGSEHGRLKSLAMTDIENASMWITKAFTYEI